MAQESDPKATVWLYGEALIVEYADELLAQYTVRYQPDKAHCARSRSRGCSRRRTSRRSCCCGS
jgi:hypothetical protein